MRPITKRQQEYIIVLSSYESSKIEDMKDIQTYLRSVSKVNVSELSINEASELIQLLLERPVLYTSPICGVTKILMKDEYNRYEIMGAIEYCLHECTEDDVNTCSHVRRMEEEEYNFIHLSLDDESTDESEIT